MKAKVGLFVQRFTARLNIVELLRAIIANCPMNSWSVKPDEK